MPHLLDTLVIEQGRPIFLLSTSHSHKDASESENQELSEKEYEDFSDELIVAIHRMPRGTSPRIQSASPTADVSSLNSDIMDDSHPLYLPSSPSELLAKSKGPALNASSGDVPHVDVNTDGNRVNDATDICAGSDSVTLSSTFGPANLEKIPPSQVPVSTAELKSDTPEDALSYHKPRRGSYSDITDFPDSNVSTIALADFQNNVHSYDTNNFSNPVPPVLSKPLANAFSVDNFQNHLPFDECFDNVGKPYNLPSFTTLPGSPANAVPSVPNPRVAPENDSDDDLLLLHGFTYPPIPRADANGVLLGWETSSDPSSTNFNASSSFAGHINTKNADNYFQNQLVNPSNTAGWSSPNGTFSKEGAFEAPNTYYAPSGYERPGIPNPDTGHLPTIVPNNNIPNIPSAVPCETTNSPNIPSIVFPVNAARQPNYFANASTGSYTNTSNTFLQQPWNSTGPSIDSNGLPFNWDPSCTKSGQNFAAFQSSSVAQTNVGPYPSEQAPASTTVENLNSYNQDVWENATSLAYNSNNGRFSTVENPLSISLSNAGHTSTHTKLIVDAMWSDNNQTPSTHSEAGRAASTSMTKQSAASTSGTSGAGPPYTYAVTPAASIPRFNLFSRPPDLVPSGSSFAMNAISTIQPTPSTSAPIPSPSTATLMSLSRILNPIQTMPPSAKSPSNQAELKDQHPSHYGEGSQNVPVRRHKQLCPAQGLWVRRGRTGFACLYKGPAKPEGCDSVLSSLRNLCRHMKEVHATVEMEMNLPTEQRIAINGMPPELLWERIVCPLRDEELGKCKFYRETNRRWEVDTMTRKERMLDDHIGSNHDPDDEAIPETRPRKRRRRN